MFARLALVVSIQREVTDALISMNVQMEPINVIKMLSVKMPKMDTCVLAIMATQVRPNKILDLFYFSF